MSSPELGYRPKSSEELSEQLEKTNVIIDPEEGGLQPPSLSESELVTMPIEEIRQKYTRRYEMYLKILRGRPRTEDKEQITTLPEDELDEMRKWLAALNSLDTYIENHHAKDSKKKLRGKQIDVFENLRDFLEAGGQNGYVKLPTGFGKTVLFIEFIKAVNLRTMIVVPTQELITQTEKSIGKHAPELETGKVYEKAKEFGRQVTIITYASLIAQIKSGNINPADYDCLVLDEAHEALGEETRKTVEQFDCLKLGFTATPDFSEEKGVRDLLETEIHKMTLREGVESGHLCSFANRVVRTTADISKVKHNGGELDEKQLAEAVDIASRNEMAIKIYKERFEGKLGVAYCVGVKHAEKLAKLFCEAEVTAESIDGAMDPKERKGVIERYERGETKVLCNADLLIAGFDEPKATVCYNLRPTKSAVVAEQRGGRVMRLDENDPDKLAYIFDFVDMGTDESGIVLFAQVAGGSYIANPDSKWGKKGALPGPAVDVPEFEIDGIEVISDEEEIMRIEQQMRIKEKEQKEPSRTLESAATELEEAHSMWKKIGEKDRRKFNIQWLLDNGYEYLYAWARANGGFDLLLSKTSPELQKDFEKREQGEKYDTETAISKLETAYKKWKDIPEKEREKFNINWLLANGCRGLYRWAKINGGFDLLLSKTSPELQKDFEKREQSPKLTSESAIVEIESAYKKWKALSEEGQGVFNVQWLLGNGYQTLYAWAKVHGGIEAIIAKSSPELQANFKKQEKNTKRTIASAVIELEAAYQEWKVLSEKERGKFNASWLRSGHGALSEWAKVHGGIEAIVAKSSPELQANFKKQEKNTKRTLESAVIELEVVYQKWKALSENDRGNFNVRFLENDNQALYAWAKVHGGIEAIVAKSSPELQANFKKQARPLKQTT